MTPIDGGSSLRPTTPSPAPRLLLADDEPHIRRILATLLEASSYVVDAVEDGSTALERLRGEGAYDLVLLDLLMPGADGLEVLQEVRSLGHRRHLPVIVLTAKGQDVDRDRAYALGASDFLTKPFSPKKLLNRLEELLGAR